MQQGPKFIMGTKILMDSRKFKQKMIDEYAKLRKFVNKNSPHCEKQISHWSIGEDGRITVIFGSKTSFKETYRYVRLKPKEEFCVFVTILQAREVQLDCDGIPTVILTELYDAYRKTLWRKRIECRLKVLEDKIWTHITPNVDYNTMRVDALESSAESEEEEEEE